MAGESIDGGTTGASASALLDSGATRQEHEQSNSALQMLCQRDDVRKVWEAMDALMGTGEKNTLWVQGPPGTGKSTSIWKRPLMMVKARGGLNALWISLGRSGNPLSAVFFRAPVFHEIRLTLTKIRIFLSAAANYILPLDLVVMDGINQSVSSDLTGADNEWLAHDENNTRWAIFSSSSKVEELRGHQNKSNSVSNSLSVDIGRVSECLYPPQSG